MSRQSSSASAERGAVATIVATLLAMGVVFGALTFAVDTGQLMYERTTQQNSADASALSLARSCATSTTTCVPGANSLGTVNDANSFDNQNAFVSQCRSASVPANPTNPLPVCGTVPDTTSDGSWTNCSQLPAQYQTADFANLPYVEVRTRTQASGLRNWFAPLRQGGAASSWVSACARAAWGPPSGGGGGELPITISACEWSRATNNGASYYARPDYTLYPTIGNGANVYPAGYGTGAAPVWPGGAVPPPNYNVGNEVVLVVQNPPSGQTPPATCPTFQGHALPGGFSILKTISGDPCKIDLKDDQWVQTDPGNSTQCDLRAWVGKVVTIPVFDCTNDSDPGVNSISGLPCTTGSGNNAWYHVVSKAKFYLSGYGVTTAGGTRNQVNSINPNSSSTLPNNANPCANNVTCISGWFTTGMAGGGGGGGLGPPTNYFGAYVVAPVG